MGVEVPIIFLTAIHRDEEYVRRGYASGAADYVTKPFDGDVLRARVKAFVDLFHQRERLRVEEVGERTRERDQALEKLATLLASEREARKEAESANRAKDEFLATVSHELRTPLSAILGWASIARRQSPSADIARALAIIERNARAQMRIVEDVLDAGRVAGGKLRLELARTRVADAIAEAVLAVRPAADAKRVRLEVRVADDVGVIEADPERLQQIVWNLLSNAIKFTPGGGCVEVVAERRETTVAVLVRDDGQGMKPELLPLVFEPFRQGDGSTTRRHGGLGLGLAIVKQLVEAHHGTIAVASDGEGRGSTFTLELPAAPLPSAPPEPARPLPGGDAPLDGIRVLVVDDDEDSRDLIACVLAEQGATVASASSADEAMRQLANGVPDVLLSDIGMPDVDGYSLLRRIRSMPVDRGGETPAIALTAYARAVDAERAFSAGFQAHVTKPIDHEVLTAVVADLAGSARR
jgi:signal transduction histidine kinase